MASAGVVRAERDQLRVTDRIGRADSHLSDPPPPAPLRALHHAHHARAPRATRSRRARAACRRGSKFALRCRPRPNAVRAVSTSRRSSHSRPAATSSSGKRGSLRWSSSRVIVVGPSSNELSRPTLLVGRTEHDLPIGGLRVARHEDARASELELLGPRFERQRACETRLEPPNPRRVQVPLVASPPPRGPSTIWRAPRGAGRCAFPSSARKPWFARRGSACELSRVQRASARPTTLRRAAPSPRGRRHRSNGSRGPASGRSGARDRRRAGAATWRAGR